MKVMYLHPRLHEKKNCYVYFTAMKDNLKNRFSSLIVTCHSLYKITELFSVS